MKILGGVKNYYYICMLTNINKFLKPNLNGWNSTH